MQAVIEHIGNDLICRTLAAPPSECRIDGEDLQPALIALAKRYDSAVGKGINDDLLMIGRELMGLLDASAWASSWAAETGARVVEIRVVDPAQPLAAALLDAPWELLANKQGFLADDESQLFEVARRIGTPAAALEPRHADLQLMFMAAAPSGADELDFEAEEGAILEATQALPLHLVVEESGTAHALAERLALDGPFEAVHLSCHGNIDPKRGPFLALEDDQGDIKPAYAGELAQTLGSAQGTALVFLSACRTAEQLRPTSDSGRATEPFVRNLVRAGIHNVLGWDGSVYDRDAADFAQSFYRELSLQSRIPRAAAVARQKLRLRNLVDPKQGQHWHLARVYLGSQGGGALAAKGLPKRKLASTSQVNQFLDEQRSEVPVASRRAFAGRRRPLQAVRRAFSAGSAGVLVHGMGNLGKSSLAHRISTRMTGHRSVVVFKQYDALAILDRLLDAVPAAQRQTARTTWRDAVVQNPAVFADAVEALLSGSLETHPVLLVIDDLERVLEKPAPDAARAATAVQSAWREPLAAVLVAFAKVNTASRLLITSRYTFTLPDSQGRDLAAALTSVPLRPMAAGERIKQLRAASSAEMLARLDLHLAERALAAADGNPGLQTTLMTPLLAGEIDAGRQAIEVIEGFRKTGVVPESLDALVARGLAQDQGNALLAFFRRMAFDVYRAALNPAQARLLSSACVFAADLPVPNAAIVAAGHALEIDDPEAALNRLLALGLMDDWGLLNQEPAVSVNPLARPLVTALDSEHARLVAAHAVPLLARSWEDDDGNVSRDVRGAELARLALLDPACDLTILDRAATAAATYLFNTRHDGKKALTDALTPTLNRLTEAGVAPSGALARIAYDCSERVGDTEIRRAALANLATRSDAAAEDIGGNLLRLARALQSEGELARAEAMLNEAAQSFATAGAEHSVLVCRSELADILQARGQLDEALRIRQQEELPVYERLGDVRSKAVAMGKIADILQARGQLDEALRIRQQEQLPVFERLGDVREKAVAMGGIADILQARGQLDDALRLHEARAAIYQAQGDLSGLAHVQYATASLMLARGDHERGGIQAIFENLSKAFEVSLQSNRADAIAGIGSLLAQVMAMGGLLDEALVILQHAYDAAAKLDREAQMDHIRQLTAMIEARRQD